MAYPLKYRQPRVRTLTKKEERLFRFYPETDSFQWHNENTKGNVADDCVIRAIARATGQRWEDVFDALCEKARELKVMPNSKKCYPKYLAEQGWTKQKQPKKLDGRKYTGQEWCRLLNEEDPDGEAGPFIAHIGGHHVVCIDFVEDGRTGAYGYKVLDTWDSTGGCIGNFWTREV